MTTTISRLYNNYGDARAAVQQLEAAGVAHSDISIIRSEEHTSELQSQDRIAYAVFCL